MGVGEIRMVYGGVKALEKNQPESARIRLPGRRIGFAVPHSRRLAPPSLGAGWNKSTTLAEQIVRLRNVRAILAPQRLPYG